MRYLLSSTVVVALMMAAPEQQPAPPPASSQTAMAELWVEPADLERRNLFYGVGGAELVPGDDQVYALQEMDPRGYSITYDVTDAKGRAWSVKIGPEAHSEVTSSRILWAMGYHQPPSYYVPQWTYTGAATAPIHGRFRPKVAWLKSVGIWKWRDNPFKGSLPFGGLLALLMLLNDTDLKDPNNELYELTEPRDGARRWYVVKDLGASLGETGVINPRRAWIEGFEQSGFIEHVHAGRVLFDFKGRHRDLLRGITTEHVGWICERLSRLSDAQWRDAFRAGGFDAPTTDRYLRALKQRIAHGLAL